MSAWRGSAHSQPTKKDFISFLIKTMNNFRVDQSGTLSWEFAGVAQDITKTNYEGWNIEAVRETYFMLNVPSSLVKKQKQKTKKLRVSPLLSLLSII